MKKVLISAYTCCPNTGSEPGNGWNWLMGYIHNQYEVHCVTSSKHKEKIENFRKQHPVENLHIYFTDTPTTLRSLKIPLLGIYVHYYLWIWSARKTIKKLTGKFAFQHAHHVTYSSIKFGTPLYNLQVKLILGPLGGGEMPHYSLKKYLGIHYYLFFIKSKISNVMAKLNPAVRLSIASADLILTSNETARKTISQYGIQKTRPMFDAGLNEYFEKPFIERCVSGKIELLWLGRMLPRKGLNLAIHAVACLPKDFDFRLTIVGNGTCLQDATRLVQEYGLDNKVTFLDKLPHESLTGVFSQSHLLLFPSLMDSCPMQVFEAFAFGLPVVTLDHQGMKYQVSELRGKKISVGKNIDYPRELAAAILGICENNEVYGKYSFNAYDFGQQQIWKHRIKHFLNNLYE